MGNEVSDRVRFGPYEADLHTHELWKHGLRIKLVGQPFEILAVMVSRPGELVTREELRTKLWPGDTFVDFNHGLNAAMNKLRDALSDSADDPRYIETLPRRGYRFVAPVERVAAITVASGVQPSPPSFSNDSQSEPDLSSDSDTLSPLSLGDCGVPSKNLFRRFWIPAFIVLIFIPLAVLVVFHLLGDPVERARKLQAETQQRFVPLTNISDATREPAFSPDGVRVAFIRQSDQPRVSGLYVKGIVENNMLQLTNDPGDCCPVWSPNRDLIAFSRISADARTVYTVSSSGGALQKMITLPPNRGELDWTPDGSQLAFTSEALPKGTSGLSLISISDLTARPLITPPASHTDWGPAFSPDGKRIAFVRGQAGGVPEDLVVMDIATGVIHTLVQQESFILGSPAWTPDGESLVFASNREGSRLWIISANGGEPAQLEGTGEPVWHPAIARVGDRLAYQKVTNPLNIWEVDPTSKNTQAAKVLVSSTAGTNVGAQFSPDGKKLAFMSDRNGSMEIWTSNRDGSNPIQLTTVHLAGTPRWSPDSKTIAFDVGWREHGAIFIVRPDGGVPQPIVQDGNNNVVPSWSRDGRWIYFTSDRSGSMQVWKTPLDGGPPVQVTTQGGFAPMESRDGKTLYFAKNGMPSPEIWQIPIAGGPETRVSPILRPGTWASWAEVGRGIYFIQQGPAGTPVLSFLDFSDHRIHSVSAMERFPFWLAVSPDGKALAFDMTSREESHIMIENGFTKSLGSSTAQIIKRCWKRPETLCSVSP